MNTTQNLQNEMYLLYGGEYSLKYSPNLQKYTNQYKVMVMLGVKIAKKVVTRGNIKMISWCVYSYELDDRL